METLLSITIGKNITSIGCYAFNGTAWSKNLPNGLVYFGTVLYKYVGEMLNNTSIEIEEGTTWICESAFYGCSSLASITIPNSVTHIGSNAFFGTSIYSHKSNWEDGVLYIDNCLIEAKKSISGAYTIKENTRLIADNAFENRSSLTSVTIPNSVTSIGNSTFSGCSSLSSITIPNSVTSIGYYAFEDCGSLNSVTIPNSVTSIGNRTFWGCSSLTSISIPNSITSIGSAAFYECSALTSITIPNSVTSIGGSAFYGCSSLTSITIPNSVTNIGDWAFSDCPSLTSITWNAKKCTDFESTYWHPFYNIQSQITSFTFGDNVEYIPAYLCYQMSALTSITIPDSVINIGMETFYGCSKVKTITIGKSVETIGKQAFWRISNCKYVYSFAQTPPTLESENVFFGSYSYEKADKLIVDTDAKDIYINNSSWKNIAEEIIAFGDLFWGEYTREIGHKSASFNIPILNYDKNENYRMGYIWNNDTISVGMVDTIKLQLTNLTSDSIYKVTFFAYNTNETIENGLILPFTFRTKNVTVAIDVTSITQTKMAVSLNCDYGELTMKEHGVIMKYPDGNIDTIPFNTNQTDSVFVSLMPNSSYSFTGYCICEEDGENQTYVSKTMTYMTKDISVWLTTTSKTQTTLQIGVHYAYDAAIIDKGVIIHFPNGIIDTMSIQNTHEGMSGDTLLTQLRINSEYDVYGFVRTKEGGLKVSNGYAIYTKNIESTITSSNRTQTTIPLSASLGLGDATDYNKNGLQWTIGSSFNSNNYETIYFKKGEFNLDTTFTKLTPNTQYAFRLFHYSVNESGKEYCVYGDTRKFTTASVVLYEPTLQTTGQTYIEVQTSSVYGDATLLEEVVEVATSKYNTPEQRVNVAGRSNVIINNLMPDTKYYFRSVLTTQEAGTMESEWYEATTEEITLATGDADGISNSSAFLHGTIDCDTMSRTEIGFEWKRSDAPSTVKPQRLLVVDRVDENLIFRLEGLSSDRYYDFRTFCLYNGKEYYGEWVGFLTSDKDILIPPSVQTREAEITDLGVLMKGFVVAGTEVILQRGFECWREESDQVATTVAEGAIMSSYIPEAWSYTTYKYRAYAKTPAGTTYGETLEVTTEYIATNIADIIVNASSNSAQVTWTMVEQADYYILTLYSDESMTEVIGVYTVDKNGNVTQKRVASATQSLVTCELTELLPETNYYFAVKAYNSDDQKVAEENGSFATTVVPTYVENTHTQSPMTDCQKIIRNGQLLILRDGKTYNIMGAEIK